ncbi:efflux RND transporter permease subunit [Wenzhouxiangella sp. AB-CW3]|uniref:efflux RND transporter permease subunit n=1 Tax=Wenzhouxiangella sp. AB-CW3 TaxID=2771012 RepID=UPI00168BBF3A|nr:efflux RND transporter permease subunit [Wenzhouxiangella sp. AB-CW3]QOC21944.1 efflux RND transporter permease subunit [Wenzhouxiangella sp. AB-CW3]
MTEKHERPESEQVDPARGTKYYSGLTHSAIRRPVGTLAIASVVLVLGLFFVDRLPVNLLPEVEFPLVRITVNYPGVAPEVMEEQVTRVLERNLSSVENLAGISSRASEGRTNVNLTFEHGVDLDIAMQNAARQLEVARQQLPSDIQPPRLRKWDPGEWAIWRAGFSSPTREPREVRDWVEQRLVPQLQSISGVASVEAAGGQVREIEVVLDQDRLRYYRLTLSDVADQLAQQNVNIAAGNITSPNFDVMARTDGRFASPDDIGDILLTVPGTERRIRLHEIADVRDGFAEQRLFVRLNGTPATQLSIYKLPEANVVQVVDAINERMAQLDESGFMPPDVHWEATRDGAYFVRGSVDAVATAAILGAVLAMVVVLAFLGSLRKSFVIGLSIPLAVLFTFVLMGLGGQTLNVISLGGLALGVGLLLDNAIVMLENISRHRDKLKKSSQDAAHDGAQEVISAITAGTLTNLAAVVPFLLITGMAALVFQELILTISFAVVASLAVALTLVPMLSAQFGKVQYRSGLNRTAIYRGFDAFIEWLIVRYRAILRPVLRWRWGVVVVSLGLFVVAVLGMGRLGNEFLPQLDDGQVNVRIHLPPGTTPEQTDEAARMVENEIRNMPHVESVFAIVGGHLHGGVVSERPGTARMDVVLTDAAERPELPAGLWVAEAQDRLRELDIPNARTWIRPPRIPGLNFGARGTDMDVMIVGEDLDTLENLAMEMVDRLDGLTGLDDIEMARDDRTPLLSIDVDRERAAALGLNVGEVGRSLRDAVTGSVPTRYSTGANEYDVRVRLPREVTGDEQQLGQLIVSSGNGRVIQLADVARFNMGEGPAHIERENQVRVQRVTGNFNTALNDAGSIMDEIRERVEAMAIPDQYGLIFAGQFETAEETDREMLTVILLALFLVFVVLAVQYDRLSNPLVIMAAAPLSLIGVVSMLAITGTPLSAPAFLGVILLIGIVVNNAILLVEYIERGRRRGLTTAEAVVEAGGIRLRPILMTTLTTVAGMTPLAIGMGSGANLMQPLAVAVIGGLLVAMLLTLFLIPCLYVIVQNASDWLVEKLTGKRPDPTLGGAETQPG